MVQYAKVDTKSKQKKTALNPRDTIFKFIRNATIDPNALLTSLNTGNVNNALWKRWFIENQIPIVPFKEIKDTFKKAPCPLTCQHSWILI